MATSHSTHRVELLNVYAKAFIRFITKIQVSETQFYKGTPCWIWKGAINPVTGYGEFKIDASRDPVVPRSSPHRYAYQYFVGAIPEGQEVDHRCHVRACANPIHLRTLTHAENQANRANCYVNSGECKNGHKMEGENVRVGKNGKQYCRTCTRENVKRFYANNPGYNETRYGKNRRKGKYIPVKERQKQQEEIITATTTPLFP